MFGNIIARSEDLALELVQHLIPLFDRMIGLLDVAVIPLDEVIFPLLRPEGLIFGPLFCLLIRWVARRS